MIGRKRLLRSIGLLIAGVVMASCSSNAYQNAVPKDCVALASVEMEVLAAQGGGDNKNMTNFLHVEKVEMCGLDFSAPVYLFESRDGDFGFCSKVADADAMKDWVEQVLTKEGVCQVREGRKGLGFAQWNDSWLMGYSDEALLVMGPVLPAAMAQLQQRMVKYLTQDEEKGLMGSRLKEVLDSMAAPVKLVSRLSALPSLVTMPFDFGVPKSAGENDAYLSASKTLKDNMLLVDGSTFSFKDKVNEEIQNAQKQLKSVEGRFFSSVLDSTAFYFVANVEGESFLQLIRSNKGLQTLLTGANMALDMDNIIRSMQGEVTMAYWASYKDDKSFAMAAQLRDENFLKDVDYWKKSCPKGTRIETVGPKAFHFTGGDTELFFGVTDDKMFYAGSNEYLAPALLPDPSSALNGEVAEEIKGKPLSLCMNVDNLALDEDEGVSAFHSVIKAVFGDVTHLVYHLKR